MAEVVIYREPVAVGFDPELAVALASMAAEARPKLPFRQRVAGVQIPHPAPWPPTRRQETVAVNVNMMQHRAGHLVDGLPRPADAANRLEPRPLAAQMSNHFGQPGLLVLGQPAELDARRVEAEALDAHEPNVAAPNRRAQIEVAACHADPP